MWRMGQEMGLPFVFTIGRVHTADCRPDHERAKMAARKSSIGQPENWPDRYMSLSEASAYVGFSKRTLYRRIEEGKLVAYQFADSRELRLSINDIRALMVPVSN